MASSAKASLTWAKGWVAAIGISSSPVAASPASSASVAALAPTALPSDLTSYYATASKRTIVSTRAGSTFSSMSANPT